MAGLLDYFSDDQNLEKLGYGLLGFAGGAMGQPSTGQAIGQGIQQALPMYMQMSAQQKARAEEEAKKQQYQKAIQTQFANDPKMQSLFGAMSPGQGLPALASHALAVPKESKVMPAYDNQTQRLVNVTEKEIRRNPSRYQPPAAQPKPTEPKTLGPKDLIGTEQKMRGEFLKSVEEPLGRINAYAAAEPIFSDPSRAAIPSGPDGKPATAIRDEKGNIISKLPDNVFDNPNAAGDVALVFQFMKSLDPRSTVREGEFQMASGIGGLSSQVQAFFGRLAEQGSLTPNQRRELMRQMRNQRDAAVKRIDEIQKTSMQTASPYSQFGVDPQRTFSAPSIPETLLGSSAFSPEVSNEEIKNQLPPLPGQIR